MFRGTATGLTIGAVARREQVEIRLLVEAVQQLADEVPVGQVLLKVDHEGRKADLASNSNGGARKSSTVAH